MAFPRGASAFETEENHAETLEARHAETPFVSATADAFPPRDDARGLADPSSDSEDEHADVAADDAWFRDDARRDARAFDRADRRERAAFRDVDAERGDAEESEGGLFSRRAPRALAAPFETDEDTRTITPPFDVFFPDDARLDRDALRRIRWLSASDAASVGGGARSFEKRREENREPAGASRTRFRLFPDVAGDDETDASSSSEDDDRTDRTIPREDAREQRATRRLATTLRVSSRKAKAADAPREGSGSRVVVSARERRTARDDAYHDALLALYRDWSPNTKAWFLSCAMDARDRGRFEAYLGSSPERLDDVVPTSFRDADDGAGAARARRAADAFERVFGRAPASGEDFALCVAPFAARDIETGEVWRFVYPEERHRAARETRPE